MLFVQELVKKRAVYIVDRNIDEPQIHSGTIIGIMKSNGSHYLRVRTENGVIRVQISGNTLPDELLNNSIFFDKSSAAEELSAYNIILRSYKKKQGKKMMGL